MQFKTRTEKISISGLDRLVGGKMDPHLHPWGAKHDEDPNPQVSSLSTHNICKGPNSSCLLFMSRPKGVALSMKLGTMAKKIKI
jgi:hypothetical protein